MKKTFSIYAMMLAGILFVSADSVHAYTTRGSQRAQPEAPKQQPQKPEPTPQKPGDTKVQESPKEQQKNNTADTQEQRDTAKCSQQDLREIKRFNVRAEKKRDEYFELMEGKDQVNTPDEAKDFAKDFGRIQEFYDSEEFKEKEKLYEKCGLEIPRPKLEGPFWVPEGAAPTEYDAM